MVSWVGHGWGHHAPGRTSDADALATAHHLLLSHGRAVQILRERSPRSEVGITLNLDTAYAAGDDDGDEAAAAWVDGFHNRWFLEPLFKGAYPEDMVEAWRDVLPEIREGDLETIAAPIDFLGVNNYTSPLVAADTDGGRSRIVRRADVDRTDMGWEVVPDGLRDLLLRLARDYAPKAIYVTENGAAYPDVRGHDGSIGDPERQAYLEAYIGAAAEAADGGAAQGLLRVVAARQLRVGVGLLEALRSHLHRLRDPRARAERKLLLVPRPDRRAARARGGRRRHVRRRTALGSSRRGGDAGGRAMEWDRRVTRGQLVQGGARAAIAGSLLGGVDLVARAGEAFAAGGAAHDVRQFVSRPDLRPPKLTILRARQDGSRQHLSRAVVGAGSARCADRRHRRASRCGSTRRRRKRR